MLWQTDTLLLNIGRLFPESRMANSITIAQRFDVTVFPRALSGNDSITVSVT